MDRIDRNDIQVLRELAKQVAEIAALPEQRETKKLWRALNGLKPVRPMVIVDQIPWHEMNVDDELTLRTKDAFCRGLEDKLRKTLYSWKHMRVDMVVEPYIEISKIIRGLGFGLSVAEDIKATDINNDLVSHSYKDQLQNDEDLEKIRMPELTLDEEATNQVFETACDIFGDTIEVRLQGHFPNFAMWDRIAELRGVENILYDLYDRPEFLHRIISKFTEVNLAILDQLEKKGLLGYGQSTIHCTGAYTDELPAYDAQIDKPGAKDIWTYGMAQMFSTVSPAMHQEFELDYAAKWHERFGLVYYGCCEPLHTKLDIVRKVPNLRKISMSPWVDVEKGAEGIGKDFVFSNKPNPAFLAGSNWEPEIVEKDLSNTLSKCNKYGCPLEFILKDISTVSYQPQKLWEWADIAMRVVGK